MTKQEHLGFNQSRFYGSVPEQYTVQPIEIDTDSKYYHPTIIIDDDYWIKGQADMPNHQFPVKRVCIWHKT